MPYLFVDDVTDFKYDHRVIYREGVLHYHNRFEIYCLTEGTCKYFIDKNAYHLEPGDLALIPGGVIHKTNYDDHPHSRYLINCKNEYIPDSMREVIPTMDYVCRAPALREEVERLFRKIGEEHVRGDGFSRDMIRCCIGELLTLLARAQKDTVRIGGEGDFVSRAVSFIQENYRGKLSLADVARHCAVSSEHLSRSFKKTTGFGFNEYLTLYRLKQAESLLLQDPKRSVAEIAYGCGFNDSNYFADRFKKFYGVSPTGIRHGQAR